MTDFGSAVRQASIQAAVTAALSPLYHTDPTKVGAIGFAVGFVIYYVVVPTVGGRLITWLKDVHQGLVHIMKESWW